jgi:hypothetical protein
MTKTLMAFVPCKTAMRMTLKMQRNVVGDTFGYEGLTRLE